MHGFYWVIDGVLAGCSRPGVRQRGGGSPGDLDDDLVWLRRQGIGAILSLTETPLAVGTIERHGLIGLHLPVDDLTAPAPDQFREALTFIDRQRAWGRRVVVHCLVGQGRAGTVLASYLIRGGLAAEDAISTLRAACPGAIGSPAQAVALEQFAARRDWLI